MTGRHAEVVFDARWLGHTGVGRVTEVLLDGLAELRPAGWTVWAPHTAAERLWPGAILHSDDRPPTAAAAQRMPWRVPRGRVHLHPHAVRPLGIRSRQVVLVHDLIPVFHGPRWRRWAWRRYFRVSLRRAAHLLVYSEATLERVRQVAGSDIPPVTRLSLGVAADLPARVAELRPSMPAGSVPFVLCVGQLKPHKNVPALVEAFTRSGFCADGGRLVVVGPVGDPGPVRAAAARSGVESQVEVLGRQSDDELAALFAGARAVIQPSLEEGFGLPVVEALAAQIPVACSNIPAHREATGGFGVFFDPHSLAAMAEGIDTVSAQASDPGWAREAAAWAKANPPQDPAVLAQSVLAVVEAERAAALRQHHG